MNEWIIVMWVGIGATAVMDLWGVIRKLLFNMPFPDYGMVGRWVGHMGNGRFHHTSIAKAVPISGERVIGWAVHYLTGIAYAVLLMGIWGFDWFRQPSVGPAMVVGLGTVAAPFLLMQPGMGAGIAASRTPRPNAARIQSLINHAVFGLGLYVSGYVLRIIYSA